MSVPKLSTKYDELEASVLREYDPVFVAIREWTCGCGHVEVSFRNANKGARVGFCRVCLHAAIVLVHPDDCEDES